MQGGALRKVPKQGWRSVSIDWFPKIYGSGIPSSLPFHKKCVARPQKSFRIDPFSKRGRRVQGGVLQGTLGVGRGHCKKYKNRGLMQGSTFYANP